MSLTQLCRPKISVFFHLVKFCDMCLPENFYAPPCIEETRKKKKGKEGKEKKRRNSSFEQHRI